ncbi:hypothetical protein BS78_01G510800 [Paspalum vaginatum]|nr:hypothetical protein BS78_01G510800 [Paspalum vaginatum]
MATSWLVRGNQAASHSYIYIPLWWGKRRSGIYDCVCQTCGSRYSVRCPHPDKAFSCKHKNVVALCRMCHGMCDVVHPSPGEFQCGHQRDATFCYFPSIA